MPNTLAHIALNVPLTRYIIKNSDILWVYLGCLIPDIPWILRKFLVVMLPTQNNYDLQIYAIIQSSLFFSLILSYCFSLLSKHKMKTFLILSFGSFLHLMLDILQIKWANGVLFFAPFNWEIINYGIFWPESFITYIITTIGFIVFLLNWKLIKKANFPVTIQRKGLIGFGVLLILYFSSPIFMMGLVREADCHYVNTLQNIDDREGKYIELDRKTIIFNNSTNSYWIESFDKSLIELSGIDNVENFRISVKGNFISSNLIRVEEYHENWEIFRDGTSYIGLLMILLAWGISIKNNLKKVIL